MRPRTFGRQEPDTWEAMEQDLRIIIHGVKEERTQQKATAHNRRKRDWRTRLSHMLHSIANKIELPEPPKPERSTYPKQT